jgi:hypothetical protein
MNTFFPGSTKPVFVQYADDLQILKVEYPLSYVLLVRHREQEAASLGSLRRLLDHDFPERTELMNRIRRRDSFAARPRSWAARFKAWTPFDRLRRWWFLVTTFTPSDDQLRRAAAWLLRAFQICDIFLKVAVIAAVCFLAMEIVEAFLPGGPAHQVISGGR